jgi:uncharacterized membrane protein
MITAKRTTTSKFILNIDVPERRSMAQISSSYGMSSSAFIVSCIYRGLDTYKQCEREIKKHDTQSKERGH